jgi:peptidoglycan/LPS O-acetylase OafA/YrhL
MQRVPAFDGLRTLAIAMVVAYHIDKDVVPAGYWGVVVFFVLSGYLLTRGLCAELDGRGHIDLKAFYSKRAARVLPGLGVLCLVLAVTGTALAAVGSTLGSYANYARIDGLDLGLLTHTWFLAVLVHFYLVWPLLIAFVPARRRVVVVGLLALGAVGWRAIAIAVMSPGWVYNATDTNSAALLAGCFIGLGRSGGWRGAGWSIPALLTLMFLPTFGEQSPAFAWGGFVAIALGVLAVQHAATSPRWLEAPLLTWLGMISYGLYLWHYIFLRTGIPVPVALGLTVATASASWYLIERPAQRLVSAIMARHRSSAGVKTVPLQAREPVAVD